MWNFDQIYQKIDRFYFKIISEEASTNHPLKKTYYLRKMEKQIYLYGPMYLPLDEYQPDSDKKSDIFEANINKEFRCIHGYTNHDEHNVLMTWVLIKSW